MTLEAEHCCVGAGGPHLRVEVLSQPRYLAGLRELVLTISRRLGFGEAAAGHIALAIDEALANVIRHGYEGAGDRPIFLAVAPIEESGRPVGVRICIEDHARQVDPAKIKSRDLEAVRPGGLGVHIIREIMDEVTYEPRPEKGMRVVMIKRINSGAGGPGAEPDARSTGEGPTT
jgi:anti-sigma regulatory factor (Ser/Thr protein kinase)